jgi:hypothetical protein
MAKGNWLVALIACAGLLGCQSMNGGPGSPGGANPLTLTERVCKAGESPCKIQSFREWVAIFFPKAAVDYERLVLEAGNKGDVLWTLADNDFYFESDGIVFAAEGQNTFNCNLVSPQNGQSQQILCGLKMGVAAGKGTEYKYAIRIHHRGWYFVWSHDPWLIN